MSANSCKRPIWQISVRTVLVIVTITSLWLGWRVAETRRIELLTAHIKSLGGGIMGTESASISLPRPYWQRVLIGRRVEHTPGAVVCDLDECQLTELLPVTARMPSIRRLHIIGGSLGPDELKAIGDAAQFDELRIDVTAVLTEPYAMAAFQLEHPDCKLISITNRPPATWFMPGAWDRFLIAATFERNRP